MIPTPQTAPPSDAGRAATRRQKSLVLICFSTSLEAIWNVHLLAQINGPNASTRVPSRPGSDPHATRNLFDPRPFPNLISTRVSTRTGIDPHLHPVQKQPAHPPDPFRPVTDRPTHALTSL
ncbi:hypothetical protein PIB30_060072 [Stylosanthes scabra]|uniref:Uncharacterized protein n=1 Tax=Stylosanthes scabra TaxID=79078 RepID=A0ABU6UJY6_9FABA|nr:hypothetical protein [Stylosanthes scabra]